MKYATAPWNSCTEQYGDTGTDWSLTQWSALQKTPLKREIKPFPDTLSQHISGLCRSDPGLLPTSVPRENGPGGV